MIAAGEGTDVSAEEPGGSDPAPNLVVRYPLPFLAAIGLVAGAVATYVVHEATLGRWIWLAVLIVGGAPLVYGTVRRIVRRQFASDVIATLAILGAIALDQAFAGVIIVLMQSSGEALDVYAFHRASASLDRLLRRAPRRARLRRGDRVVEVAVADVTPGDTLVIRTGDVLPVDGAIAGGEALLDESAMTGEPLPRRRLPGETAVSGTVNVGPPFDLRADRPARDSRYARIVELVRSAQERKPGIQRLADRYAVWFTPLTLAVAAFGWWWTATPVTALAVLVVATPCPLIIATPIAVIGAVNRAADRGIVVKSGGAIEEIGRAKVVVFDKTGTLTAGQPEVDRVVSFDPAWSPGELLRVAAAVEQFSSHPLAAAVVREVRETAPDPSLAIEIEEAPGAGIQGRVGDRRVLVGSSALLRTRLGVSLEPEWAALRARGDLRGRLVAFVAVDSTPRGAVLFADRLRPGVAGLVDQLRDFGVRRVVVLTGDNRANAEEVARDAGIAEFYAELLPEDKVERVRGYRNRDGSTVMVGDGINDAAALASASVGVAMGAHGAGISTEAADVVFLVDDVTRIGEGISLGQRMVRIARQGIAFGLGASLVLMAVAALGHVIPALGAVLQEVLDVLVILNALRVR